MSIQECIDITTKVKVSGIVGFLSSDGLANYQRAEAASQYYLPENNTISEIIASGDDIDKALEDRLRDLVFSQMQRIKRQRPLINILTVATPALDVVFPDQLKSIDSGLELLSLSEVIASHCAEAKFKCVGLLGTAWDMDLTGPLANALSSRGIEARAPEEQALRHLMTECVLSRMQGVHRYDGKLRAANECCAYVVKRMLFESVGTIQAFIICNPELRPFMAQIRNCFKGQDKAIAVIDALNLHRAALIGALKDPPS